MNTKRKEPPISERDDELDHEIKTDDDGNLYLELSSSRRISIRKWQSKILIDIREYYEDKDGSQKPGKKGISLSIDQYESLKKLIPLIDSQIDKIK